MTKRGKRLVGTSLTINPDLIFDPWAVGDVKYKLDWAAWPRADLYQSVAFAAGFRRQRALIVNFVTSDRLPLSAARFGETEISNLHWLSTEAVPPAEAELRLIAGVAEWWARVVSDSQPAFAA